MPGGISGWHSEVSICPDADSHIRERDTAVLGQQQAYRRQAAFVALERRRSQPLKMAPQPAGADARFPFDTEPI